MKIGLISDIHADLGGLQRALNLLAKQQVEHIFCMGDLVDRGPEGDAVVAHIQSEHIACVQGNHDWMARINYDYFQQHPERNVVGASLLKEETITFLDNLPRTLTYEFEGRSLMLAHGSPSSVDEYIHHNAPLATFKQVLRSAKTSIVILGHTHIPMVIRLKQYGMIINPGSVYQNYASTVYPHLGGQSCAVLELPYGKVIHYDINTAEIMPAVRRIL